MGTTEEMLSIILNLALWQLFSESFKAIAIHLLICLTSYSYSILNSLIIPFPTLAPITTLRFPFCVQVTITMQLIKRFYSLGDSPIHILITTDVSEDLSYSSDLCIEQKCLPDFFHTEHFPTANLESELKLMKMR